MPLFLVPSVGIRRREGLVKNGVTKLLKFVWFSVLIQKYESVIRLSSFLAKKIKKKVKKMNKICNTLVINEI